MGKALNSASAYHARGTAPVGGDRRARPGGGVPGSVPGKGPGIKGAGHSCLGAGHSSQLETRALTHNNLLSGRGVKLRGSNQVTAIIEKGEN